jgi:hypothetical protein
MPIKTIETMYAHCTCDLILINTLETSLITILMVPLVSNIQP